MVARLSGARVFVVSLCSIAAITAFCFAFERSTPTVPALLLLLTVMLTAISTRLVYAVVTASIATLCLDFFFFPPIGRIVISDPQNWVALLVFFAICLIAGQLSNQLRRQRDQLLEQRGEAERLNRLSRSLLMSSTGEEMRRVIVNGSTQVFELDHFSFWELLSGEFYRSDLDLPIPETNLKQADRAEQLQIAGAEWHVHPLRLGNMRLGGMAYVRRLPIPDRTVELWATTVALGLAQVQAQEATTKAAAIRRSEELKSVMIDALAHDLKTPLTSIEAAGDVLSQATRLSARQTSEMVAVIREESRGLRQLVDEAIHLARIDAKRLKLELRHEEPKDLVSAAVHSLGERSGLERIEVRLAPGLPQVVVDSELIVQALKQLIDNALKYGPPQSAVLITGKEADGIVTIAVRDSGPGLTELEQSRVFEKFYRGQHDRSAIQGTGMGLAITREILEAHGGSVSVRSYPGQGTEFYITLSAAARALSISEASLA